MAKYGSVFITLTDKDFTEVSNAGDGKGFCAAMQKLLGELASGCTRGSVLVDQATTYATGTFTLASVIATDAVSINGTTFTCVASGATGNQFNLGGTDILTAAALAAAINASATALVNEHVTATSSGAVVTVTAAYPGTPGNAITIASADGTITASGARLTGGADGTEDSYSFGV